jgi:hypothetical protein
MSRSREAKRVGGSGKQQLDADVKMKKEREEDKKMTSPRALTADPLEEVRESDSYLCR